MDGSYHNVFDERNVKQIYNDQLKNQILEKAELPLIRCKTDGIPDEKERGNDAMNFGCGRQISRGGGPTEHRLKK